jgi:hypothetical protein
MQDPNNLGAGAGFPLYPCDGYASPLRADIHFPSCYNPAAGLDDYKNNMAWPTITNGKQNCPTGYTHVPHIFFELYWDTPQFNDLWTPNGKDQPFTLANGDVTGYSLHGDFISGWDQDTLKTIIDTCDAGDSGMDTCPQIPGGLNDDKNCKLTSPIVEALSLTSCLTALPGDNPLSGWSYGSSSSGSGSSDTGSSSSAGSYPTSAVKTSPVATSAGSYPTSSAAESSDPISSATSATYAVSSASSGGEKPETTSTPSTTQLPETTTATSVAADDTAYPTAVASNVKKPSAGSDPFISTVYDIVTATETVTVWAEETSPVKRHAHEHVGHIARHRQSNQIRH